MVDSTNPRIMADNIRKLEGKITANDVVANPTGDTTADLTKIEIDGVKYDIVVETAAEDVSYDNTDSGLTADDVQAAIDEISLIVNKSVVLWEGTLSKAGTITIDNLSDWLLIGVYTSANILAIGTPRFGGSNYGAYASNTISSVAYRFNVSSTGLEVTANDRGFIVDNKSTYSEDTDCTITKIIGLLK